MKKKIFFSILSIALLSSCTINSADFEVFYLNNVVPFFESFDINNYSFYIYNNDQTESYSLNVADSSALKEVYESKAFTTDNLHLSFDCRVPTNSQEDSTKTQCIYNQISYYGGEEENCYLILEDNTYTNLTQQISIWNLNMCNEVYTISDSNSDDVYNQKQFNIESSDYFNSDGSFLANVTTYSKTITESTENTTSSLEENVLTKDITSNYFTYSYSYEIISYNSQETKTLYINNSFVIKNKTSKYDEDMNNFYWTEDITDIYEATQTSNFSEIFLNVTTNHKSYVYDEAISDDMNLVEETIENSTKSVIFESIFPQSENSNYSSTYFYNTFWQLEHESGIEAIIHEIIFLANLDTQTAFTEDAKYMNIFDGYSYTLGDFKVVYDNYGYPMTIAYKENGVSKVYRISLYEKIY